MDESFTFLFARFCLFRLSDFLESCFAPGACRLPTCLRCCVYEYVLPNIKLKIICYFLLDEVDCRLVKIQQIGDEDEIRFGLTFFVDGVFVSAPTLFFLLHDQSAMPPAHCCLPAV